MINSKAVETKSFYISKPEDYEPILRVEKKLGVEVIPEDLDENDQIYNELLGDNKGKFLVVCQLDCSSDIELKKKMASADRPIKKIAEAMIVRSLANRLEASFYIRNVKPGHPVAIFTSEAEGIKWLKTLG